jgi:hypothetical protein
MVRCVEARLDATFFEALGDCFDDRRCAAEFVGFAGLFRDVKVHGHRLLHWLAKEEIGWTMNAAEGC